jgi:pyridoxal phosphate enzyme (YggS family)
MIERNLLLVKNKIEQFCKTYKKDSKKINLIAVSKTVEETKIIEAIKAGQKFFGENYIKEAKEKWPKIKAEFPQIELHFIGHLQSNKAAEAVELFDFIHSLDSEKLALALKKEIQKRGKHPKIFIQVNIGDEEQKDGVEIKDLPQLIKFSKEECGLNIIGLMCVPPSNEAASPYFALLKKLARENNLENLSMGMSADFEEAIALDSNYVRIGTAVFGKRV